MTGCERILARLERGPATAAELYSSTYCIVHSRIAELRKRGYEISCEHLGGTGADTYIYSLLSEGPQGNPSPVPFTEKADSATDPSGFLPGSKGSSFEPPVAAVSETPQSSLASVADQLTLQVAA